MVVVALDVGDFLPGPFRSTFVVVVDCGAALGGSGAALAALSAGDCTGRWCFGTVGGSALCA